MLLATECSQAEEAAQPCRYVNLKTMPITFDGLRPTVEGSINGSPVAMVIDTGASTTLILRGTAEKLKLPLTHSRGVVLGIGGESAEYLVRLKEMVIGPVRASKVDLKVSWDSSNLSNGALIGADFLFQRDLEISLADGLVKFFYPVGCNDAFLAYWDKNASVIAMESSSSNNRSPVVIVELNGQKIRAVIDTGAEKSIVGLGAAARAGVTPQSPNVIKAQPNYGVGESRVESWIAPFDSFVIGGESIKNTKIQIADLFGAAKGGTPYVIGSDLPEMLLGADFLRAHRVLFAVGQKQFYFSYLGGTVFDADGKQKADWYRKAAERGSADAQFKLGTLYERGDGVTQNNEQAVTWYRKAADQGNLYAQNNLGHMYMGGRGVPKDHAQAMFWYEKAANQGYVPAYVTYGRVLFFSGDYTKSAMNFAHAVEKMPQGVYERIWLYLARARSGEADVALKELAANSKAIQSHSWPAPVMDLYLGTINNDAFFKIADDKDARKSKAQMCEANFYAAEWYLLQEKQKEAQTLLATAARDCPKNVLEYFGAVAESERLQSAR